MNTSFTRRMLSWIVTFVAWFFALPMVILVAHATLPSWSVWIATLAAAYGIRVFVRSWFNRGSNGGYIAPTWQGRENAPSRPNFTPPRPAAGTRRSSRVEIGDQREFGVAGGAIGSGGDFGAAATAAGVEGERRTGDMLRRGLMAQHPNAFVIHGLLWPGSQRADIDHVAYVPTTRGDYLFVIDSKRWKRGDYAFDGTRAYFNGAPSHEVKFPDAVDKMAAMYPRATTIGIVIVHGAQRVDDRQYGPHNTFMMTPDQAMKYIESTVGAPVDSMPDLSAVRSLIAQRKS